MEHGVDESGSEHKGSGQVAGQSPEGPSVEQEGFCPEPGNGPGDPDFHDEEYDEASAHGNQDMASFGQSAVVKSQDGPIDGGPNGPRSPQNLKRLGGECEAIVSLEDFSQSFGGLPSPADLLEIMPRETGQ